MSTWGVTLSISLTSSRTLAMAGRGVGDDQLIVAHVDAGDAPFGQDAFDVGQDLVFGVGVVDRDVFRDQGLGELLRGPRLALGLESGLPLLVFLADGGQGGDPQDVALLEHAELVHLQHQIENLIPGHRIVQGEGDPPVTFLSMAKFLPLTSLRIRKTFLMSVS